jgi:hypothetical protein
MGTIVRRKYIEIPNDYWTSTWNGQYIIKESDAKRTKRD